MKYKDIKVGDVLYLYSDRSIMVFFVKSKGYKDMVFGERIEGFYYTFNLSIKYFTKDESFLYKKTERNKRQLTYNNMCDNWHVGIPTKHLEKIFNVIFRS